MVLSAGLIKTLVAVGPTIVRSVGELLGKDSKKTADKVASILDSAKTNTEAEQLLELQLRELDIAEKNALMQLHVKILELENDRVSSQLNHELGIYSQSQNTARTEQEHGDAYVKHTRPKMARMSGYAGTAYILLMEAAQTLAVFSSKTLPGADWQLAAALYGPLISYMGMRTVDAFSKYKTGISTRVKGGL